jgi:hypothetical protein
VRLAGSPVDQQRARGPWAGGNQNLTTHRRAFCQCRRLCEGTSCFTIDGLSPQQRKVKADTINELPADPELDGIAPDESWRAHGFFEMDTLDASNTELPSVVHDLVSPVVADHERHGIRQTASTMPRRESAPFDLRAGGALRTRVG